MKNTDKIFTLGLIPSGMVGLAAGLEIFVLVCISLAWSLILTWLCKTCGHISCPVRAARLKGGNV